MSIIDDDDELEAQRRRAASAPEFSYETTANDVWTAVYYGIPVNCDPALARHAHGAAMQCAGAVAGPPGLSMHAFEPMQGELGADKTREENFEHAVRRLDELNSRLRPAILDDEAERQASEPQPAAETEQNEKAKLAEEVLFQQGDMHSHYDIGPWEGGFAVFRTYEIDDAMLDQYGLPTGQQKLGEAETLPELHQAIIDGSALAVVPLWITDAEREQETDTAAERRDQPAAEKEPMTVKVIERDTWNAVDLDIPADADRAFLATVALAAEHCEKFAGAAARVGQVMEPELVEFYQERQTAAADRRDEAWRQFTVRAPEQGSETRLLNPEQMQDRAMSSLHEQAHEHREAAGQGAEITHEALDKNPWVVLTGVLAEFDDRELLDRIDGTLHELRDEATQRGAAAVSPEEAELWRVVAGDAESRGREAREEMADLTARESADEISRPLDELDSRLRPTMLDDEAERQAPELQPAAEKARAEFTLDDVQDESWAVVEKEIPRDADTALLEQAQKTVLENVRSYEDILVTYDGAPGFEEQAPYLEERLEKATARLGELTEILDERRSPDMSGRPRDAVALAERVRFLIENPHLEGAERDDGVLQTLAEQREELGLAESARQDDDTPQVEYSQEPEVQSSADRDAAEFDYLFGREEMTEARAAAYDRFTGQELSPRTSQSAGQVQEAGQSQSHTRGRSR